MVTFPQRSVLSHAVVSALLAEIEQRALESGIGLCAAVCDEASLLAGLVRTDGARPHNIALARAKAETAMSFGVSTEQWRRLSEDDHATLLGLLGGIGTIGLFGGGLPITAEDAVVGGLGVSGPDENKDIEFASAAIAAVLG
jgi:uncharacterized protein GlcG (DUF336 family)